MKNFVADIRGIFSWRRPANYVFFLLVAIAIVFGGYYAYSAYAAARDARAYKLLMSDIDLYGIAIEADEAQERTAKQKTLWAETEQAFRSTYEAISRSHAAPFALAFQAQALIAQGDVAAAMPVMDKVVIQLPLSLPFYGLYAVKRALMKLDSTDAAVVKQAIDELTALGQESGNVARDEALYYLGEYYFTHNEPARAQQLWNELIALARTGKNEVPSPWALLVVGRLS